MNEFIKVPELSGLQKAAILLTELDSQGTDRVLACLSKTEKDKLFEAVSSMGSANIHDEIRVMEEANKFGVRRGIAKPVRSDEEIRAEMNSALLDKNKNKGLRDFINQNPDTVASALSAWIRGD